MSKHWNPRGLGGGRLPTREPPGWSLSWNEIRLVLLGGMLMGLGYTFVPVGTTDPAEGGGAQVTDPWAVDVIDGDTFRYRGDTMRIADIDTPEIKARCAYEARLAGKATDRMGALLAAGPFALEPIHGRDEDRYGRKLRIVTRGGRSLGDQMVAEGLARTWTGRREPWCA